jgi:hypothetical protein
MQMRLDCVLLPGYYFIVIPLNMSGNASLSRGDLNSRS